MKHALGSCVRYVSIQSLARVMNWALLEDQRVGLQELSHSERVSAVGEFVVHREADGVNHLGTTFLEEVLSSLL